MVETLNGALADYAVPVHLDVEGVRKLYSRSGVDAKVSVGAFVDGRLVGFILNSCGVYQGGKCAFMVAAGVLPEYRGRGVFTQMEEAAERKCRGMRLDAYYLEVLQQNERAVALYRRLGFEVVRPLAVLMWKGCGENVAPAPVENSSYGEFAAIGTGDCHVVPTSYEHSSGVLLRNPGVYRVAYTQSEGRVSAFCVYSPEGGLVQIGYTCLEGLARVIRHLQGRYEVLFAKNTCLTDNALTSLLPGLGFQEVTRQFEMVKRLG